jgi:hypothetical protein
MGLSATCPLFPQPNILLLSRKEQGEIDPDDNELLTTAALELELVVVVAVFGLDKLIVNAGKVG